MVTGEPVKSRRYENPAAIFMSALVRLALWFLMVVLSSMAIIPNLPSLFANHIPAFCPLTVENASTFITKMVKPEYACLTLFNSFSCCLFGEDTHRITRCGTSSDICSGISFATQLRYTPFGAMIRAKLHLPSRNRVPRLSIRTFDLPVPISIKNPYASLFPA